MYSLALLCFISNGRYKELMDDPKVPNFDTLPKHGHLIRWVHQGVLLLNAVMTVREKEPNSHQNKGWEQVTDEIIRTVLMYHCTNKDVTLTSTEQSSDTTGTTNTAMLKGRGCVFLLWGKPATTKAMNVIESVMTKNHTATARRHPTATNNNNNKQKTHAIICTSHPSPLGARKTSTPFLGSQCFSRCNEELIAMGHDPIDWNV
jgi:uracil-DNA glycosylase